jgi:hypothetical protein
MNLVGFQKVPIGYQLQLNLAAGHSLRRFLQFDTSSSFSKYYENRFPKTI